VPRLRILLCASEAPLPAFNGVRLVVWNLCRELARRHDLSVVALRWPDQYGEPPAGFAYHELAAEVPSLPERLRERARSIAYRKPVDAIRFGARMQSEVARLRAHETYDIAHVVGGALAEVATSLDGLPAIIAPLDVWSVNVAAASMHASGLRRQWLDLQTRIVRRYTGYAYRPFARTVLVSDEDARDTASADRAISTAVIPNGVDSDYYAIHPEIERDRRLMLFTGTLSYPPNIMAAAFLANEVLPRVRRDVPDAHLVIAGRHPSSSVLALARQQGVSICADVADLRPLLATTGVFACGMTHGTGIKNKLLEAMACGAPAVSTMLGCRGLAVVHGREVLVADAPDAFAAAVVQLFKTPSLADRLGSAARRYVVACHSWAAIATRYEALYEEVLGR
jgi:glycosyltransferase involved in cell wall biosynthesis